MVQITGKPNKRTVLVGYRVGKLDVLSFSDISPAGHSRWLCRCVCGNETIVMGTNLRRGHTRSCGCDRGRPAGGTHETHGHRPATQSSPTYKSWMSMKGRCLYPSMNGYKNYGGRGITFCDRWHSFSNFLSDMGERPLGLTLDRINVDGNYEPANCRWSTPSEQQYNRRRS